MKRLIIILILMFLPISAFAEIHGFFEMGKTVENEWAKAEMELQYHFDIWKFHNQIYGGWETWFIFNELIGSPFRDIYHLGYKIEYKKLYAEIEHFCNHPVYSSYNIGWWYDNIKGQGRLTTISVGVNW